ncbi:MAG: hypothetical protein ISN29_09560 [Gammaproteobacteria bacterium AqS3]|nr:hypothetical protein [Gammaproteobacteria bacterium AqS3]
MSAPQSPLRGLWLAGLLLAAAVVGTGQTGATQGQEESEALTPETAEQQYDKIYGIVRQHQRGALLVQMRLRFGRCHQPLKFQTQKCQEHIEDLIIAVKKLQRAMQATGIDTQALADFYCTAAENRDPSVSGGDVSELRKHCRRTKRWAERININAKEFVEQQVKDRAHTKDEDD